MCEPTTIAIMIAASVAMSVASVAVQNSQRKNQNRIKDQAAELQGRAFAASQAQVGNKFSGDQIAASEEQQQIRINAMKLRATSQAGASNSGVTGLSVDAVLADFDRQEGRAISTVKQGLSLRKESVNLALESARLGHEGALFNLRKESFNPAAAALQIAGAGFQAYSTFKANTPAETG